MPKSALLLCFVPLLAKAQGAVDFVKDIQPIFAEHCQGCHGARKQEAAFRLDHKPSALKGGDFGAAIVPGHAQDSRLIHAVLGTNPKMRMPRKGEPLTAGQIAKLKAWIDEGAPWPDSASAKLETQIDHWAFKPVARPKVPANSPHPIDAFVHARLTQEHLTPAAEAAPETLIRRLYLDLLGLPPPPADVDAFTAEYKPGRKDEVWLRWVNKILANPHYGERWGRHWLDAARYADSNGYEKDPMRYIWFYRDWVINAFNRDLPYDRFIIEQLAGDLLPNATQEQIVATGFLRNSMVNEEGGVDPEQFRMEAMYDRMDAIGKSILGLTLSCTQCHNHKYDPITQEEYYRLFAFLNNDNEPWRVVYTAEEQMRRSQVLDRIKDLEDRLKRENADWQARMAVWENSAYYDTEWHTLQALFIDDTTGGQKMLLQPDGSFLAQSYAPTRSAPKFEITLDKDVTISGFRLELLNDPNLPAYGPGRSQKGTAALTEFVVETGAEPKAVKFSRATADFGEPENTALVSYAKDKDREKDNRVTGPVTYAIDGKDQTAWGIDAGPGRRNQPRKAVFTCEQPITMPKGGKLAISLSMKHGGWNSDDLQTMNLGRFRISYTTATNPEADPLPKAVRDAMALPNPKRTQTQQAAIFSHFRTTVPEWSTINAEIESAWKDHPEGTTTLVLDRRDEARMTHVHKRGDFLKPGDRVSTGVPAFLNPLPPGADSSRLTLAKWLTDPKSPTTARAFVNRVWQAYFGTGLSGTPEDLGTQGEAPSHPQLLDWLAAEFMRPSGEAAPWSIKHLHRLIVTSATYRQDSRVTPALLETDPYNRLLARGPRFRVEGEVVRDIQLAVSGLLNPQLGGRSVMPPAPAYAPFPWKTEEDSAKYRRSVYTFRRRSTPYPFLSTFDVPTGEVSCVRRVKSNTPLQALMTLNETLSMEAARALGQRLLREGGRSDVERITFGFKLCTARAPTPKELRLLTDMLRRHQPQEQAYTLAARVLLNLDESITKE
jgi:mono/diheme cytochrome c family protein